MMVGRSFYRLVDGECRKVFVLDEDDDIYLVSDCPYYEGAHDYTPYHMKGGVFWAYPRDIDAWLAYDQNMLRSLGRLQAQAHNLIVEIETCYFPPTCEVTF